MIALARISQQHAWLARHPESRAAERLLACAEKVWQRAICAELVAQ